MNLISFKIKPGSLGVR